MKTNKQIDLSMAIKQWEDENKAIKDKLVKSRHIGVMGELFPETTRYFVDKKTGRIYCKLGVDTRQVGKNWIPITFWLVYENEHDNNPSLCGWSILCGEYVDYASTPAELYERSLGVDFSVDAYLTIWDDNNIVFDDTQFCEQMYFSSYVDLLQFLKKVYGVK